MHILERWELDDVKRKAEHADGRLHELDSIRRDVDRLEHTDREICSMVDGLRYELIAALNRISRLEQELVELRQEKEVTASTSIHVYAS